MRWKASRATLGPFSSNFSNSIRGTRRRRRRWRNWGDRLTVVSHGFANQSDKSYSLHQEHITVLIVSQDIQIVRRWDTSHKAVALQLAEHAVDLRHDASSPEP